MNREVTFTMKDMIRQGGPDQVGGGRVHRSRGRGGAQALPTPGAAS